MQETVAVSERFGVCLGYMTALKMEPFGSIAPRWVYHAWERLYTERDPIKLKLFSSITNDQKRRKQYEQKITEKISGFN